MGFMTTILEKIVILCAQVYLLVIMLMILGLRWWQMMAMKDFQIWVLATCSLPSLPVLDTLDEAIFQPTSSSLSAEPSFLFQDTWLRDVIACPEVIVPLSSPKPSLTKPLRVQGELRWLQGGGGAGVSSEHLSCCFTSGFERKPLASFLCLAHDSCFHPHTIASISIPSRGCSVRIWGNFQGFGWKICRDWSVRSPSPTPWVRVTTTRSSR